MISSTGKLRAWGNSIGIILPKNELKEKNLGVNDEVVITIIKKKSPLQEAFGKLKGHKPKTNKSTDDLLKEIDREFDSKFD